jgi:hypothetical protein
MKPLEQRISETVRAIKFAYHCAVLRSQAISSDINLRISGSHHLRSITHLPDPADDSFFNRKGSTDSTSDSATATTFSPDHEDMWLCTRYYRQAVVELSHHLQAHRHKVSHFNEEKNILSNKIKLLFVATMQLYCHERSRIFLESVDYLKKVKGKMMDWNSETDLRLKSPPSNRSHKHSLSVGDREGGGEGGDGSSAVTGNDRPTSIETIDAINTTLDVLEQTSNAVDILASLKLETPLASLPNCSEQILIQSIMQYTSLDTANKILSSMKEDQKKGGGGSSGRRASLLDDPPSSSGGGGGGGQSDGQQHVPSFADFISVKVIATADGLLHLFPLEEKKSASRSGDFSKPFRSLKIEVPLFSPDTD